MKVTTYAHMPNMLDGTLHPIQRLRFSRPLSELRECVQEMRDARPVCDWCDTGKVVPRHGGYEAHVFESPWDEDPHILHFCTREEQDEWYDSYHYYENYFYCDWCNREVAESNGRMSYQHIWDDSEVICLKCYEEEILANGQPEEDFKGCSIRGGMFFNYGNPELFGAGYEVLADHVTIASQEEAAGYNRKARAYIERGWQLVTCFERMSVLGDEGTITLMGKMKGESQL